MRRTGVAAAVVLAAVTTIALGTGSGGGMRIWKRIFGRRQESPAAGVGPGSPREEIEALRLPAIRIEPSEARGFSKVGGSPNLPPDVPWPEWKGKPLGFLAQLDLAAMPPFPGTSPLPSRGYLFVFYEAEESTWGFDPEDAGSWRVVHLEDVAGATPRAAPPGLPRESAFREKHVGFSIVGSYPEPTDDRVLALGLSDAQRDEYLELRHEPFHGRARHQLLGYPMCIQGADMDLECQLASHRVYVGGPEGYREPRVAALLPGRSDWMLLLQLDSDDGAGMMWGDAGTLYFWIRRDDLRKKDFRNVWMVLQCY